MTNDSLYKMILSMSLPLIKELS